MNNENVLYIPIDNNCLDTVQYGYVDALGHMGFNVHVYKPLTKLACKHFLEQYNINIIFTHSKYGIRCLPIDYINNNKVVVIIRVYPFNAIDILKFNYEDANDEISLIGQINDYVCHTHLERSCWNTYLNKWENNVPLLFIPLAGNIIRSLPESFDKIIDLLTISNISQKMNTALSIIIPLVCRLGDLGYSYKIFGDSEWLKTGINCSGFLNIYKNNFATLYGSSKVCLNIINSDYAKTQLYVNDKLFNIILSGGYQITNNPLSSTYVDDIKIIESTNQLINEAVYAINRNSIPSLEVINKVANEHTYLIRLSKLFDNSGLSNISEKMLEENSRLATRYCWELENKLGVKDGRSLEETQTEPCIANT